MFLIFMHITALLATHDCTYVRIFAEILELCVSLKSAMLTSKLRKQNRDSVRTFKVCLKLKIQQQTKVEIQTTYITLNTGWH